MVDVADVRKELNNISTQRVSDVVMTFKLDQATKRITRMSTEDTLAEDKDSTILAYAAYDCYLGYAIEVERSAGGMPPAVGANLRELYTKYLFWLSVISGVSSTVSYGHVAGKLGLPISLYDDDTRDPSSRGRMA